MENISNIESLHETPKGASNSKSKTVTTVIRRPLAQIENISECFNRSPVITTTPSTNSSSCSFSSSSLLPPLLFDGSSHHTPASLALSTPTPSSRSREAVAIFSTPIQINSRPTHSSSKSSARSSTRKRRKILNPFEKPAHLLKFPIVSPSLFETVVSPSDKEDEEGEPMWAIEQLAVLYPAQFDTPLQQTDASPDSEYERKAQEAIDRFFNSTSVVIPSPWTDSNSQSLNLLSLISSSTSSHQVHLSSSPALLPAKSSIGLASESSSHNNPLPSTQGPASSVWCQTELTFPPVLPKEIEDVLSQFCTFTQDQSGEENATADCSFLNNTTLRRKLMFNDEISNPPPCTDEKWLPQPGGSSTEAGSSPTWPGAKPLDDDVDGSLPWGVSMIRPPAGGRGGVPWPPPPSPESGPSRVSCSSVEETSPIQYLPPDQFRTLFTPPGSGDGTDRSAPYAPSAAAFFVSPKLSPILVADRSFKTPSPHNHYPNNQHPLPCTPKSRGGPGGYRFACSFDFRPPKYPKRGRGSANPRSPSLFINSCPCPESRRASPSAMRWRSAFIETFSSEVFIRPSVRDQALLRDASPRRGVSGSPIAVKTANKSSPQFCSSPIKASVECDRVSGTEARDSDVSGGREHASAASFDFSVSPIAPWRLAPPPPSSSFEAEPDKTWSRRPASTRVLAPDKSSFSMDCTTDPDFPFCSEETSGDFSSGQDTGYQTTSSIQATNLTSQMGALYNNQSSSRFVGHSPTRTTHDQSSLVLTNLHSGVLSLGQTNDDSIHVKCETVPSRLSGFDNLAKAAPVSLVTKSQKRPRSPCYSSTTDI